MSEQNDQIEAFQSRFEEIDAFLDQVAEDLSQGVVRDLSGLDRVIDHLCAEVQSSDAAVAKDMQPVMAQMIGKLDTIVQDLEAHKQRLQQGKEG